MISRVLILSFALCLSTSCTSAPINSNTATINTAPSPSAIPSPAQPARSSAQITLPVLDALLADEKFVGQLRSNLKLTDEQVNSLKQASSEEIAHLRETNAEGVDTNSSDARTRAAEKMNTILGDAKARELDSFANDYWSKGDQSDTSAEKTKGPEMLKGPNAVPTDTRVVVNIPAFRM